MSARALSVFASLGHAIVSTAKGTLRSRIGRGGLALTVAGGSIGIASLCFNARVFFVGLLGFGFLYFGLLLAWELLPFSEETRARWARQRELSARYTSYRWRNCLWYGLGFGALQWWGATVSGTFDPMMVLYPGTLIAVGAVAQWIWHRRCLREDLDIP